LLSPGVYEETLIWPSINGVHLIGNEYYGCIVKPEGTGLPRADCLAIAVNPSVQAETFEMTIQNILLDYSDGKGLQLNNTNVGRKLNCYLSHVVGEGTGRFLDVVHTDEDECIRVYMDGDSYEIEGLIYFVVKNADDRLYCSNVWLAGGIQTSADDIAANIRLKDCIIKHEGVTGGHGSQKIWAMGCYSETAGTYALLDTNDLAGSHTESLLVPTS